MVALQDMGFVTMTWLSRGSNDMRFTGLALILFLFTTAAQAVDETISAHPDQNVRTFYETMWPQIAELRSTINENSDEADRLASFGQLATLFPLAAEVTARGLVTDIDTELALGAIRFLKLNTVMSNHDMSAGLDQLSPAVAYSMRQHMASREALRAGITDSRMEVRRETASYLASLSGEVALQAISSSVGSMYSDVEAANLYTLASGETGEAFLRKYLGAGPVAAQQTAVSYLSAIPGYQGEIRASYFLNPEAPVDARTTAALALSAYDRSFPEYALAATHGENVSPSFVGAALNGYIAAQNLKGRPIQADIAEALSVELSNSLLNVDASLLSSEVQGELQQLQQQLEAIMSTSDRMRR